MPWSSISRETQRDETLCTITVYVANGFPEDPPSHLTMLKPYWRYKGAFYVTDGVLMYNGRIVIPPILRHQVL